MIDVSVHWSEITGAVKPMHGVGQPPFAGMDFSMFHYLTEAGIPFSRLHDVGGMFGGGVFVDIPNLFRDFSADPACPASYDFAFTDRLLCALVKAGIEPFFRLGVTIESHINVRQYRLLPPADFQKWARICEGVIRHYNEGWADGYHMGIRYWEIWNEPDNAPDNAENQMWWGTAEEYFRLYDVTAKHLKACFPELKIGGFASCGFYGILEKESSPDAACSPRTQYFLDFFDDFLAYIREHGSPMDFFSWHSYGSIRDTMQYAAYARKKLDEAGYANVEHTCNEWNCEPTQRGTLRHTANTAGMLLAMQDSSLASAMFYDARLGVSVYGGLFHPMTRRPLPAYYAFVAFNELYKRKNAVRVDCRSEGECYACAAVDENGAGALMLANPTDTAQPLSLHLDEKAVRSVKTITEGHVWEDTTLPETLGAYTTLLIFAE